MRGPDDLRDSCFGRGLKTISESNSGLMVLVLPRSSQLNLIVSLIGGFRGLWVVTQ